MVRTIGATAYGDSMRFESEVSADKNFWLDRSLEKFPYDGRVLDTHSGDGFSTHRYGVHGPGSTKILARRFSVVDAVDIDPKQIARLKIVLMIANIRNVNVHMTDYLSFLRGVNPREYIFVNVDPSALAELGACHEDILYLVDFLLKVPYSEFTIPIRQRGSDLFKEFFEFNVPSGDTEEGLNICKQKVVHWFEGKGFDTKIVYLFKGKYIRLGLRT